MVEEVKEIFFLKNLIRLEKQKTSDGVTREFLGSQRMSIIAIAKKKENRVSANIDQQNIKAEGVYMSPFLIRAAERKL